MSELIADRAPIRVVLGDRLDLFRKGLSLILEADGGIQVVGEGADSEQVLAAVSGRGSAVVLLDIEPQFDGIDACRRIKEREPAARVVMLTHSDDEGDLYEALKAGASGYLLKDSSVSEVVNAVRAVASGQSLISPAMAAKLIDGFKIAARGERPEPVAARLTERELEVLRLVARGLNNREVGRQLLISENTVKNHVRNILDKLGLHSRMEAVIFALREKLLDLS